MKKQTYAEWFAISLKIGSKAGPAPNGGNPTPPKWYRKAQALNDKRKALGMAASINRQTDAYKTNPAGAAPPWE